MFFYAAKQPFKGSLGIFPKRKKNNTPTNTIRVESAFSLILISIQSFLFRLYSVQWTVCFMLQHVLNTSYNRVIFYFHHQPFKQWITHFQSKKKLEPFVLTTRESFNLICMPWLYHQISQVPKDGHQPVG